MLAVIALAEQTALNSISPYLPAMASTFPEVARGQQGLYVGLIASSFALAQFSTNFFWGWLSDRIGRKPVVLIGTITTAACFFAFGFCRTLWQAILVQVFMGLGNGNQAVISTCLGEITDRSNQSKAFTYLPVIYGIGGITGPLLGGLLAGRGGTEMTKTYPYLVPNMLSAGILLVDAIITILYLEESLEDVQGLPPFGKRFQNLFPQFWQFLGGSTRPTYTRPGSGDDDESEIDEDEATEGGDSTTEPDTTHLHAKDVLNRDTILILATFFIFQLSNISYNSLYPVFAQAAAPTGRDLNPEEIGISLGFAGAITILFQVGVFGRLRDKIGNRTTYRIGLGLFVLAYFLMPFVAYKEEESGEPGLGVGKGALWTELGIVLIIKTVATVGSLTSALLLVSIVVYSIVIALADYDIDHQLRTEPLCSGHAQRSSTNPFCCRSSNWTFHCWRTVLLLHARQAKGGSPCFWNFRRYCTDRLSSEFWHQRNRTRSWRLG